MRPQTVGLRAFSCVNTIHSQYCNIIPKKHLYKYKYLLIVKIRQATAKK